MSHVVISPENGTNLTIVTQPPRPVTIQRPGVQGAKGEQGDQGNPGSNGWMPVLAIVADGERRVQQVSSWTGGTGTPPASGVYVGGGGFVTDIALAVDIRGPSGDMDATVYDPQGIEADAFARANHTGTQTLATISDAGTMAAETAGDYTKTAALSAVALSGAYNDLSGKPTLGAAAALNVGTTAGTVAAGDHTHAAATTSDAGFMSAADKTKLNGIEAGAQVNAVTSVAGNTGAVSAQNLKDAVASSYMQTVMDDADAPAARATLGAQAALGFTPVQQGTGVGQWGDDIKIGHSPVGPRATVDTVDFGRLWTDKEAGYTPAQTGVSIVKLPTGGMIVEGTFAGTPNDAGDIAGAFGATFVDAPRVVACNGDAPSTPSVIVSVYNQLTTAFIARVHNHDGTPCTIAVRINFIAVGRWK